MREHVRNRRGRGLGGRGRCLLTERDANVDEYSNDLFGRGGIGGGSRGPGELMGYNWDGHRGEGDQQIEAGSEEHFGEPSREGHDFETKRVSHKSLAGVYIEEPVSSTYPPVTVILAVYSGRVALQWEALS